ncbi:MAG: CDP-glycerol glycerophosphotransferase family protein [Lachnospiraceae bacterium]|nr:CDP-glycerol glycerophosphotransferase family protein [Lachnospiraceae bacterium]
MFRIRQYLKMLLQNVFLPLAYAWYARRPVQKGLVLFADAHHDSIPFSMRRMYEEVQKSSSDLELQVFVRDFNKMSYGQMVKYLLQFMKRYAAAEYVFICDYYLPVASCKKRPETAVVQLWHSCGLMKKIAYDAGDDIPANYRGNMFGNYTWLTLSAEVCVPVHERALRLPGERIRATGVSRTDYYFDKAWNDGCREAFYSQYPQARGKKIALWAPTFRGNAARPRLCGLEEIQEAAQKLQPDWYFIIKVHPHIDAHGQVSNCRIPTEELLCVADVLITDYSSVMFDYLIYQKPLILFAPDLKEYEDGRGFYIDYSAMPFPITEDAEQLAVEVENSLCGSAEQSAALKEWKELYTGACDGHASRRILELVGLG